MSYYNSLPISQWVPIVSPSTLDVLAITDVNDHTQSPSGSTKKITLQQIHDFVAGGITWNTVTSGPVNLLTFEGYISDGTTLIDFVLPTTANVGDQFYIEGLGVGLFTITQHASQSIIFGNQQTSVGVAGSITSTDPGDGISFMCVVTNTTFKVRGAVGNFTII